MFLRRIVLLANSHARLRPATSPCAPTRHARGMSGFSTRQLQYFEEAHKTLMSLPIYVETGTVALCKTDPVIERKRRPTSKYTQQSNQSPKEQVQKSKPLHTEEAFRLRAGSAPFSAPGARCSARRKRQGHERGEPQ